MLNDCTQQIMILYDIFWTCSGAEAWTAVPLVSLHMPSFGLIFWTNAWAVSAVFAVLAACYSNAQNHLVAMAGYSAVSALRLSVANFWSNQILERVHIKWRSVFARSMAANAQNTNRLVCAWIHQTRVQRKTTLSWLVVLFFVLLASNAFGLVPFFSAVTGQAGTTLGLSLAFWAAVAYAAMQRLGVRFVKLFLPSGPSWPMAPLFVLLESISYTFRAISLGVRLWANMLAGHQLIHLVTALSLVPALCLNFVIGAPITVLTAGLLMALSGLETVVCVLQSGVFCLLASFYLQEGLSRKDTLAAACSFNESL